ncbi:uncharacterized protein LOC128720661 [Anopheles nili]|uniref:uncharacterized protein LOC128720661 n=1 Tax=Anopheles nili TaxID=185578 RepID=UPI00237A287F|nr:uncharacterized protein LOC128720661 [Anopheles nili]
MSKTKTNGKKVAKSVRNVLAQPFNVIWPTIPDNDATRCSKYLQRIDRKRIVSGCNGVIKLLQNGQALAFFILASFNPQIFAKLIIQMARKRNPAVLVLALPSFPVGYSDNSMIMAITEDKGHEQPEPIQNLLKWMKALSVRNGFISKQNEHPKPETSQLSPKGKIQPDLSMTDEEVAKFYVFESTSEAGSSDGKNSMKHLASEESEHFISLSGYSSSSAVTKSKPQQQLINRRPFQQAYVPLKVKRVQGNPNRTEHKKKKRT